MIQEIRRKRTMMKRVYICYCPFGLGLGLWILVWPSNFWDMIGGGGSDPIQSTIYGAVLCGLGIMFFLASREPLRYLPLLQLMMIYKTIFLASLFPRLLAGDGVTVPAWIVGGAFLSVILVCALVYPWGRWIEVRRALGEETHSR